MYIIPMLTQSTDQDGPHPVLYKTPDQIEKNINHTKTCLQDAEDM